MGMTTVQENRILGALTQAQNVGLVEERVTVCGCPVVLRNLRPEEYEAILQESSDKKDASFLYAFQMGHICRAVCEISGVDLRGLEYIETQEGDKKVTLERHEWMRAKVLTSWSREALTVLYRKFVDVLAKAETVSVEGVVFTVPDESNEDKFHRLLAELKALEDELPDDLVSHALETQGYRRKQEDAKAGADKLDAVAAETTMPVPEPEPEQAVARPARAASLVIAERPFIQTVSAEEAPAEAPVPGVVNPLDLIKRKQGPRSRADQIAELEAATANLVPEQAHRMPSSDDEPVVLERPGPKLDPAGAATILDRPPTVGINPRFRPHGR